MADTGGAVGHDAFYLDATAHEFGWEVTWEPDGSVMLSRKGVWTVVVFFDPGGVFGSAQALGPGARATGLTLPRTVDALEHWGTR